MPFTLNSTFSSPNSKQSPSKKSLLSTPYQTLSTSRTQKSLTPQYLQKKFEDLYLQNQRWSAKRQKLREQHLMTKVESEMKECTFQPAVNPQVDYNGSSPSPFLKREIDWVQKKQKKIEQLARQTQKKLTKQCSFHPKISSKSYAILNNAFKTSRTFLSKNQMGQQCNKSLHLKKGVCYRQMHTKKSGFKQLQKANSIHQFALMTERRFIKKMGIEQNDDNYNYEHENKNVRSFKIDESDDYIENIVIKTEEQNTFDSLTSLGLQATRKNQVEEKAEEKADEYSQDIEAQKSESENEEEREVHQTATKKDQQQAEPVNK